MSRLLIATVATCAVLSLSSNTIAQVNDYAPDYSEQQAKEAAKTLGNKVEQDAQILKDSNGDQMNSDQNLLRKPLVPVSPTVQNTPTAKQLVMPPPLPAETGVDENGNITVTTQDQDLQDTSQSENVIFNDPTPPTNLIVPNTQKINPPNAALPAPTTSTEAAMPEVPSLNEAQNTQTNAATVQTQNNMVSPTQPTIPSQDHSTPPQVTVTQSATNICSTGKAQSPINIAQFAQQNLPSLNLSYNRTPIIIQNTGKTLELQYKSGSKILINGKSYDLKTVDFHSPSEHYYNGAPYPMEAHLKHVAQDGSISIVGVMMRVGQQDNEVIDKIWKKIPKRAGAKGSSSKQYNIVNFLPNNQKYYTYSGSLTKAPCTENVTWIMMQQSVDISPSQLRTFQSVFKPNARIIQPLNGRQVQGN